MADLRELRDRVANLTGPDREVDAALWVELGIFERDDPGAFKAVEPDWRLHYAKELARNRFPLGGVPQYTSSVDAVLSLIAKVLPGWRTELLQGGTVERMWWDAYIVQPPDYDVGGETKQGMSTPALALLLALLEAKSTPSSEP